MDQVIEIAPVKLQQTPEPEANYFENNQVLSAEQLNNVVTYFDYQQRLSRTRLAGVGIVCGLQVSYDATAVIVTRGCGITTDGDLIHLDSDAVYSEVIPFDDKNAHYPFFVSKEDSTSQISLWELVTSTTTDEDAQPLSSFFVNDNIANNYVVLLYLESYPLDADLCTSDDCINRGLIQKNTLHAVLINKNDLQQITSTSACCSDQYSGLPELAVRRVIFNPKGIFQFSDMAVAYQNAIAATLPDLQPALQSCDAVFFNLTSCNSQAGNNIFSGTTSIGSGASDSSGNTSAVNLISNINAQIAKLAGQPGIQYVYDFIKDVTEAYNEFKEAVFDLCVNCCPDPAMFPKHLIIGELIPSGNGFSSFRTDFCESPILSRKNEWVEKALLFYQRIEALSSNFNFVPGDKQEIRITPSYTTDRPLSERSIPFYYNSSIANKWSFEKNERRKTNTILSYNADEYSALPQATDPLSFDLDQFDFFRIEGHIGKTYEDAFAQINNLRINRDLPFDIIGLQLEAVRETIVPTKPIEFPWLNTLFEANKYILSEHTDRVTSFNNNIFNIIPPQADTLVNEFDPADPIRGNVSQIHQNISTGLNTLNSKLDVLRTNLQKNIQETEPQVYATAHDDTVQPTSDLTQNLKLFTTHAMLNPVETYFHSAQPRLIDWIKQLHDSKTDEVKDAYVFTNYLQRHPALLHEGGVSKGGTFILIYESQTKKVVADFYIPYICYQDETKPSAVIPPVQVKPLPNVLWPNLVKTEFYMPRTLQALNLQTVSKTTDLSTKYDLVTSQVNDNMKTLVTSYQTGMQTFTTSLPGFLNANTRGSISPGILGTAVNSYTNPVYQAVDNAISNAAAQKAEIQGRINKGTALPDDAANLTHLDNIIADNSAQAISILAAKTTPATAEDQQLINTLQVNASALGTTAKTAVSSALKKNIEANKSNQIASTNLSGLLTNIRKP